MSVNILPRPKEVTEKDKRIYLGDLHDLNCVLIYDEEAEGAAAMAVNKIKQAFRNKTGLSPRGSTINSGNTGENVKIIIGTRIMGIDVPEKEQAYSIKMDEEKIIISGGDAAGTLYGAVTFSKLLAIDENILYLDMVEIEDYPDYQHRGLYIESKWGTDLMTLEDWQEAIDYAVDLKMNFIGIGIYGCWVTQYDNQITEFLNVPLSEYPDLETEKTIRYYLAGEKRWENLTYSSVMFTEDIFDKIIAYARERDIIVRPQFNSFGHNTLIPRLYPEVSAVDEEGNPTHYGFCLSNPRTYELLYSMFDYVIDKYLLPNGVKWFHLGLDEVWKSIGIDPENLHREVDPWCKCEQCTSVDNEDLFVNFLLKLAGHLKKKGIENITVWNDQLSRHMDILDQDFVDKVEEAGLKDNLILNWWCYSPEITDPPYFETTRPELGLRSFVTPMPGYFFWMNYINYMTNINNLLDLGGRENAEGCEAYCTYDPAFDRNYYALAEFSWNQDECLDVDEFNEKYREYIFGEKSSDVVEALNAFDSVVAQEEEIGNYVNSNLLYYRYTYVRKELDYPRDFPGEAFTKLYQDLKESKEFLKEGLSKVKEARKGFEEVQGRQVLKPELIDEYIVEALRYETILNAYLEIVDIKSGYDNMSGEVDEDKLEKIIRSSQEITGSIEELMYKIEKVKKPYLQPQILRDLSVFRNFTVALTDFLKEAGEQEELPHLSLTDTRWAHNQYQ